ncbi:phage tail protein [Pseudomonas laurylsulfatiphila]|uniref:phage tail protein n=1 Tax=Pseudomonas laurylsulfatiphila TaxID=2011015 RepID=UPI003D1B12C1
MIDANSQFFAILTNVGMAKQANADALGVPWTFSQMGVGDANNTDPIPSATQTKLINEHRRRPLNQVKIDPNNAAVIIAEQVIPADEGGWWIREIGLYDADGDLVAVANCAPSFKPVLSQGSGRTQVVRMNFIVASSGNITLKIDPAVVVATREYVDTRLMEELYKLDSKQSVRVATTANIVLAGLQTVDGVALATGDRVLVKNQTVAKDNGIWLAAALAWKRAADADSNAEVTSALLTSVEQGATQADTRWQLTTDGAIVVGTTSLTFQNVTSGFAPINAPALINPTGNTPAQFDSSLRLVTSAFLKRMGLEYGDYTNYSASAVLTVADIGKVAAFASGAAMLATLPVGSGTIPRGAFVGVVCGLGSLTVTCDASEQIDAINYVGNISMALGDTAEFVRIGNLWRLIGGTVALKYAGIMSGPNWVTQAQFSNDKSFATTEYVRRQGLQYSSYLSVTANTVLTLAEVGGLTSFASASPQGCTLPATSTIPATAPAIITVANAGAGLVTVVPGAGDTLNTLNGVVGNIVLGQGDIAEFLRLGGQWRLIGGTIAVRYSAMFAGSNAASGYQKLPNNQQECRGTFTASATPGAPVAVTFPQGFGRVDEVIVTPMNASATTTSAWGDSPTPSGFNGRCNIASLVCHYVAKGTSV